MIRSLLCVWLLWLGSAVHATETLRLAVTTSFHNSGLADILVPQILVDLDVDVQLLVVGTGQALRLGRSGDVDAILVHSQAAEEAFVADGYGSHRREIMYNDFVIIGPQDDPAKIMESPSAKDALRRISAAQATFVSRGDDSGTHRKELHLWAEAERSPQGRWYNAVGAGMGAALSTASGLNAYLLSDRASWLNFANKGDLVLLFSGDPILFNQYAYLPVSAARHPHIKADQTARLETWLTSDTAKALINGYTIDGEQLFTFNATP